MQRTLIAVLIAASGLGSWAGAAHAGLLSSTGRVIAVLGDELFLGEAEGHLNGSGTLVIQSQKSADLSCRGQFASSALAGGAGQLQCSDGSTASFTFQRLTLRSGHGTGGFARGSMSFTYGLTADESRRYLALPAGSKLEENGRVLQLVKAAP